MLKLVPLALTALLFSACGELTIGQTPNCLATFTTVSASTGDATLDTATRELAQSFRTDSTSTVSTVELKLVASVTLTGTLQLLIQTDASGQPSGVSVSTTGTSDATKVLTNSPAYYRFVFTTPASLTRDTTYWLRLKAPNLAAGTTLTWSGNNANAYASGGAKYYDGTNWSAVLGSNLDLFFNVGCI